MIKKLAHTDIEISKKIRAVFQVSYAVEAKILNAIDFPPLKRNLESFMNCENDFFGFFKANELSAVIEISKKSAFIHVQSLVVAPTYFRQGIGKALMDFVLDLYSPTLFMVETGVDNGPATKLYKKIGFKEVKQWDTEFGIRKIRFEKLEN